MKNALFGILVIVAAGIVSACLDEAESHSGISAAEFDAYKAEVEARFAALEANQPGDKVFAGGTTSGAFAKVARAGARDIGTAVGFLPVDVPAHRSNAFMLKSAAGFIYSVPNDNINTNGVVGIGGLGLGGGITGLYFASADCSGQGYVSSASLSDYGASQGVVFRLHDGEFNATIDNPAQYFYVGIDTKRVDNVAYMSATDNVSKCTPETGTLPWGYPVLPNDPAVTGVESAPIAIPITIS